MTTTPLPFIRGRRTRPDTLPKQPKPAWLKVKAPGSGNYQRLKTLMRTLNLHTVPQRLAERGDPMAGIDASAGSLETLLEMYDADIAGGLTDMPYPPDYPKMPGEPPRVQPSRKNALNWEAE